LFSWLRRQIRRQLTRLLRGLVGIWGTKSLGEFAAFQIASRTGWMILRIHRQAMHLRHIQHRNRCSVAPQQVVFSNGFQRNLGLIRRATFLRHRPPNLGHSLSRTRSESVAADLDRFVPSALHDRGNQARLFSQISENSFVARKLRTTNLGFPCRASAARSK